MPLNPLEPHCAASLRQNICVHLRTVALNSDSSSLSSRVIPRRWGWLGFNCGSTFGISGHKWVLAARYDFLYHFLSSVWLTNWYLFLFLLPCERWFFFNLRLASSRPGEKNCAWFLLCQQFGRKYSYNHKEQSGLLSR